MTVRREDWALSRVSVWLALTFSLVQALVQEGQSGQAWAGPTPAAARVECRPGQLRFMMTHAPIDIQLTPDKRSLLVVDKDVLSQRELPSLVATQYLVAQSAHWSSATFSSDRSSLVATDLKGGRQQITLGSFATKPLPAAPDPHALARQQIFLKGQPRDDRSELARLEDPTVVWQSKEDVLVTDSHKNQQLLLLVTRLGGERFITARARLTMGPIVFAQPDRDRFFVASAAGEVLLLDSALRIVQRFTLRLPKPQQDSKDRESRLALLQYDGTHLLAVTQTGDVLILETRSRQQRQVAAPLSQIEPAHELVDGPAPADALEHTGRLTRRLWQRVWGPRSEQSHAVRLDQVLEILSNRSKTTAVPRQFLRLLYRPQQEQLIWLTKDHEIAVYDLRQRRVQARLLSSAQHGVDAAQFTAEGHLLLLSSGVLRSWDVDTQTLRFARTGPYFSMALVDREHALATRPGGYGDLLRLRDGTVERSLCLTREPCMDVPERTLQTTLQAMLEAVKHGDGYGSIHRLGEDALTLDWSALRDYLFGRQVHVDVSPDGRYLLTLRSLGQRLGKETPLGRGSRTITPQELSIWDLSSWSRVSSSPLAMRFANMEHEEGRLSFPNTPFPNSCVYSPADCIHFTADGMLRYFAQRYTVPDLRLVPLALVGEGLAADRDQVRLIERDRLRLRLQFFPDTSDRVQVLGADGRPVLEVATPVRSDRTASHEESEDEPSAQSEDEPSADMAVQPHDKASGKPQTEEEERAAELELKVGAKVRRLSLAAIAPGGGRFVLASRSDLPIPSAEDPAAALVFCASPDTTPRLPPAAPSTAPALRVGSPARPRDPQIELLLARCPKEPQTCLDAAERLQSSAADPLEVHEQAEQLVILACINGSAAGCAQRAVQWEPHEPARAGHARGLACELGHVPSCQKEMRRGAISDLVAVQKLQAGCQRGDAQGCAALDSLGWTVVQGALWIPVPSLGMLSDKTQRLFIPQDSRHLLLVNGNTHLLLDAEDGRLLDFQIHRENSGAEQLLSGTQPARSLIKREESKLLIWDQHRTRQLAIPRGGLSAMARSADGSRLATLQSNATGSQVIGIWDLEAGRDVGLSMPAPAGSQSLSMSPDGSAVAIIGRPAIVLSNLKTGQKTLLPHEAWEGQVQFSPDSKQLAVQSGTALFLVNVATGAQRALALPPEHKAAKIELLWASGSEQLFANVGGGTLLSWTLQSQPQPQPQQPRILNAGFANATAGRNRVQGQVALDPRGEIAAFVVSGELRLLNTRTGALAQPPLRLERTSGSPQWLAFSPNGHQLVVGPLRMAAESSRTFYEVSQGEALQWNPPHGEPTLLVLQLAPAGPHRPTIQMISSRDSTRAGAVLPTWYRDLVATLRRPAPHALASVVCRVTTAEKPLLGVTIKLKQVLSDKDLPAQPMEVGGQTDRDGKLALELPSGSAWLGSVEAPGMERSFNSVSARDGSPCEFQLSPGAVLTGRITRADGRPGAGAELVLVSGNGGQTYTARADAQGIYRVAGLRRDFYAIAARLADGQCRSKNIHFEYRQDQMNVDLALAPLSDPLTVRARILGDSGKPRSDFAVGFRSKKGGGMGSSAPPFPDGARCYNAYPMEGELELEIGNRVVGRIGLPRPAETIVRVPDATVLVRYPTLAAWRTARGADPNAANIQLLLRDPRNPAQLMVKQAVASNGKDRVRAGELTHAGVKFEYLTGGSWVIAVEYSDHSVGMTRVEVPAGGALELPAPLSHEAEQPGRTLRGRVVDPAGRPIVGATVGTIAWAIPGRMEIPTLQIERDARTDALGRFRLALLHRQQLLFGVSRVGYLPRETAVKLGPATEIDVGDIVLQPDPRMRLWALPPAYAHLLEPRTDMVWPGFEVLNNQDGSLGVYSIKASSPAVGQLQERDVITSIDGVSTLGMNRFDAEALLRVRGARTLTVLPSGTGPPKQVVFPADVTAREPVFLGVEEN